MATEHTPGPWQVDEVPTSCGRAFRIGAGEMLKAGKGCCIIYDDYPGDPENQRKANACLIAAAPDMLAALRALEVYAPDVGVDEFRQALKSARAAIAKAEGR